MTSPHDIVVLTGAAGFIGSHLAIALRERGMHVIGVDNFDSFYDRSAKARNVDRINQVSDGGFELIEADIRDGARMRDLFAQHRPIALFHIAALAGVRPSISDPARYADVNVNGLLTMLDAARAVDCGRVIFASSSSVYGNNSKVPFAEDDRVDEPISPYAATKRAGELICHAYSHLFNMRIACLRFFTVYGPAQRPDLAIGKFMRLIAAGEEVPMFGDGSTSRDYTFINDIISGVMAAFDFVSAKNNGKGAGSNASQCRIFNLGNSHPVTLAELIEGIAKVVGKSPRIKRLPMQPGDVERTWADLSRSHAELEYQPHTPLPEGLRVQWEWLQRSL